MISTVRAVARDITPPVIWRFAGRLNAQIRRRPQSHEPTTSVPMTLDPMAKDPFLKWLSFIVPGWLHRGNVQLFDHCFAAFKKSREGVCRTDSEREAMSGRIAAAH